jgi:hypothetical protein
VLDFRKWGPVIAAVLDREPGGKYATGKTFRTWPGLDAQTLGRELWWHDFNVTQAGLDWLFQCVGKRKHKIGPAEIGRCLGLTAAIRRAAEVRLILAVDEDATQRNAAVAERRNRKRRSITREAYLAESKERLKPWEADGISRRTWYRRKAKNEETILVASGERRVLPYRDSVSRRGDCGRFVDANQADDASRNLVIAGVRIAPTITGIAVAAKARIAAAVPGFSGEGIKRRGRIKRTGVAVIGDIITAEVSSHLAIFVYVACGRIVLYPLVYSHLITSLLGREHEAYRSSDRASRCGAGAQSRENPSSVDRQSRKNLPAVGRRSRIPYYRVCFSSLISPQCSNATSSLVV